MSYVPVCKKLTRISNLVQSVVVNEKAEIDHPLVDLQITKAKASMKLCEDG